MNLRSISYPSHDAPRNTSSGLERSKDLSTCESICLVTGGRLYYASAYMLGIFESTLLISPYNPLATISTYHMHPLPPVRHERERR